MALKIRLRAQGRHNRETYRLVLADCRSPRDGKYIEMLGWYNPFESELDRHVSIKADRIQHWLDQGAQMTESAQTLIKKLAPTIVRQHGEKALAQRAKAAMKRKARKKEQAKSK
jgi:small subunit ribosomal protein S16